MYDKQTGLLMKYFLHEYFGVEDKDYEIKNGYMIKRKPKETKKQKGENNGRQK